MTKNRDSRSGSMGRLVGTWTTEATHPAMPGVVVRGTAVIEWLQGEQFLTLRACTDHQDFPDSLSVIGDMGQDRVGNAPGSVPTDADASRLRMHYFDSRGVFRVYDVTVEDAAWRWWRDAPGFSQRFTGAIAADGNTIDGRSQLCEDDVHWTDDLQIMYRRRPSNVACRTRPGIARRSTEMASERSGPGGGLLTCGIFLTGML